MGDPTHNLLIVEDDPTQRTLAKAALSKHGWKTLEATNGLEGLKIIQEHERIVVLTDLNMPEMDGLTMLRKAGKERVRSVVLTASDEPQTIIGAFNTGATDFITKPVKDWAYVNTLLMNADEQLQDELSKDSQMEALQKQADWQYWKALFLSGGQNSDMERVLDMMHIQFNQDANYNNILNMLKAQEVENGTVKVPDDLFQLVCGALDPIARFADGIGIAQTVMHKDLTLQSRTVPEFCTYVTDIYNNQITALAQKHGRKVTIWVDDTTRLREGFAHIEVDLLEATITEVVTNALKYSDDDDQVDINVQAVDSENISILVTNPARNTTRGRDGNMTQGLPRELEELAFRFFIRFSINTQMSYREQWPMGLGLPLARRVLEGHGGSISIHNENWHLGGGSSSHVLVACRIQLPIHAEALAPAEETSEGTDDDFDNLELF